MQNSCHYYYKKMVKIMVNGFNGKKLTYPKSMKISYTKHVTNETVLKRVDQNRKQATIITSIPLAATMASRTAI